MNHCERLVEHHARADDTWTLRDVRADGVVELASLGCALALSEIYVKVEIARP